MEERVTEPGHYFSLLGLAPTAGLEPATSSLTARRSTTELCRIILLLFPVVVRKRLVEL
jgi:hypothetical protein